MRIRRTVAAVGGIALALGVAAAPAAAETNAELREQVRKTEVAFAKTLADRDHAAFVSFIADDVVWMGSSVFRGRKQVAEGWKRFYEGKEAPFSWEPERVEVNDSGTLGLSTGPVRDPAGKRIGTYNSIWRRGADGKWMIIFDNGCPPCECPPASPSP
jgi:ketosteroid isomerase-like protein